MESLCPQSAEAIANNEDLLTQILLCLPARSLMPFKCVSNQWLSLISNPKFCDRHTLQNPRSKISAFFSGMSNADFYSISLPNNENPSGCPSEPLNFIEDPTSIQIVDSCNGLLLCCSWGPWRPEYVVNPTTNQFFTLPLTIQSTMIWSVSLAFDPSKSLHYKVICVQSSNAYIDYSDSPPLQVEVEIYSSETRSWRMGKSTFVDLFGIDFSHGVYCNGAIHWLNTEGTLLHYDIDEECFGVVPSSPGSKLWEYRYFGESRGHLYRVENFRPCITEFVVQEMGMDYFGWSVKYNVDLHPIISAFPELVPDYYESYSSFVLSLAREENEEDASLLLHIPCKLISYNLRDKTFNKLCDLTPRGTETESGLQLGREDTFKYIETLACV